MTEQTKPKYCPTCGVRLMELEEKHYCFNCCSEIKEEKKEDERK